MNHLAKSFVPGIVPVESYPRNARKKGHLGATESDTKRRRFATTPSDRIPLFMLYAPIAHISFELPTHGRAKASEVLIPFALVFS